MGNRFSWRVVLVALVGCMAMVSAADSHDYEVVTPDQIYLGKGKHPKTPAVIKADDVWDQIPEYKKIVEDELTEDDPKYHILMKKATARFNKGLKKLSKRDSHDMIGEKDSIKVLNKKKKLDDATKELIKLVSRN